jgi:RNA polymerase sigma-70 factor, ECF subfamily
MSSDALALSDPGCSAVPRSPQARLEALVREHFAFVWRNLRRLGLTASDADDAAQHVFLTAARKLSSIEVGRERAFLFATALKISAAQRRKGRRHALLLVNFAVQLEPARADDPESLLEQRRGRELLDALLGELPLELRAVLVLCEIEQLPREEVADMLGLRPGTVASRLRRGREFLERRVRRLRARLERQGGAR